MSDILELRRKFTDSIKAQKEKEPGFDLMTKGILATQKNGENFSENTPATTLQNLQNRHLSEFNELLPLPSGLLDVEALNLETLPSVIANHIFDVAERMQTPPDFAAISAMTALGFMIARFAEIRPKREDDWTVSPILWGVCIGSPGTLKSPSQGEALRPLHKLQSEAVEKFHDEKKAAGEDAFLAKFEKDNLEKAIKAAMKEGDREKARKIATELKQAEEGRKITLKRYIVNDSTMEALGVTLQDNPGGILAFNDEIIGLLKSMDKQGQEGSRAFYLQGADGRLGYTFDRISREQVHIPCVRIGLLGSTQPSKIRSYIYDATNGGSGDDGLLQRFSLAVWPDQSKTWKNVDRKPDAAAFEQVLELYRRLDTLAQENSETPLVFRFESAAQALFDDWRGELELELRSGQNHHALESHLSKYRKLVPSLALIIAVCDGDNDLRVSERSLIKAILFSKYLRSHAERLYAAAANNHYEAAKILLGKIKSGKLAAQFKPRDIQQKGWSGVNTTDTIYNALSVLCDCGYLKKTVTTGGELGGRPSEFYDVNPLVLREVSHD